MTQRSPAHEGRDNGITAARLGLALLVIVSHSFMLSGHGPEPLVRETGGQVSLGFLAVLGFFGLSGWLLAASRDRNSLGRFIQNRIRRIVPAYLLALLVGAVAILYLGGTLSGAAGYVVTNVTIVIPGQGGDPDGSAINGSLWTLGPEVLCYALLAIAPIRWLRPVSVGMLAMFVVIWPALPGSETQLFLAFAAGTVARLFATPTDVGTSIAVGLLAAVLFWLELAPLASIATAYAALGLRHLPLRFGADLSYGTYVFAYPIAKMLPPMDPIPLALWTIAIVLPLAFLSWEFVERRAMRARPRRACTSDSRPVRRTPRWGAL